MTKLIPLDSLKELDYEKLGLKCGLEIHQQLNTGKLFCNCPCIIVPNGTLDKSIERKLRFSLSETGDVDIAAEAEFRKGKYNVYRFNDQIACLVDLDEEPPHEVNEKALKTAVSVGKMLNMTFFDKLQFMRKLIIDGSVTSGFQRTAMLGFDGHLETSYGKVDIQSINLEEDSCRTIEREEKHTIFSLDRQGIPLIEIATGPQVKTPDQAYELAYMIGNILRSYPDVKRGLGTIRQDLNVSIKGGARVEIKGAQNLKLIPEIVKAEVKRQYMHLMILEELKRRKVTSKNFSDTKIHDVTTVFRNTESKVIRTILEDRKAAVLAIRLNSFKGILGHEMQENFRFATEISNRNKMHFPSIKGLFHSDEMPNYGITEEEVRSIEKELELGAEDSFILLANEKEMAKASLQFILEIISELITLVPSEVRQVDPKGTITKFLRPMPGSARMYPETDVPDLSLSTYLQAVSLPELFDKKIERVSKEFDLEKARTEEVLEKFSEEEIKRLIEVSGRNAAGLYNIIFELPKDIRKREGIEPQDFKVELLEDILKTSKENDLNQQVIRDIFISLYKDNLENVASIKDYIDQKGLVKEQVSDEEIEAKLKEIIDKNAGAPLGALMGHAMKQFGGSVDGRRISQKLKDLLQ